MAAGIVWAATVVLDGQTGDWAGISPLATDAKGNAPKNADIVAFFTQRDTTRVFFRIDADIELDAAAVNQSPTVNAGADQTITLPAGANLNGSASDDGLPNPPAALTVAWSLVSGPGTASFGNTSTAVTTVSFSQDGVYVLRLTAGDGALTRTDDLQITVNPASAPPDLVASALDTTAATTLGSSTAFLYTGAGAVQTGVSPTAIEERRAAVIRGKVVTRDGTPLPDVTVTILGHPEFGQTRTRSDGMFDLAVNGGGPLTANYATRGYLTVQRPLDVPWQDFVVAPDVVMTPIDSRASTITAGAATLQLHRGTTVSDDDGSRTSVLLFPAGTTAQMVLPGGSIQPLASFAVRATEYTVGPQGPEAMPAPLPTNSAYTYAVDLSVDEAIAAGAIRVEFSQPVVNYVENFLGFPVGSAVPAGFYDRVKGAWTAQDNGRVVKITGVTNGYADVDTTGTRALPPLLLSEAERERLAQLYPTGTTLWRVPVAHFSPWDYNWPFGPPADADDPADLGARAQRSDASIDGSCEYAASVIECENRVLGEDVQIPGTPYALHYRSNRTPGYGASVDLNLSGPSLPASLRRIELRATIAGRVIERSFSPAPNQSTTIEWDGFDAYGRAAQGGQWISGSIDYFYPLQYLSPADFSKNFGNFGGTTVFGPGRLGSEFRASMPFRLPMREGLADARELGLGGWTLDVHHFYDPTTSTLDLGSGQRRRAETVSRIFTNARQVTYWVDGFAIGRDGAIYSSESYDGRSVSHRIWRTDPNGTVTLFAGGGGGLNRGDGGPATQAQIGAPKGLNFGPDGSLYFFDDGVVRRVRPDGIVERVAGKYPEDDYANCDTYSHLVNVAPDGALALESHLCIREMLVGPDGSLYLLELIGASSQPRIRRVGPDGRLVTVLGGGGICNWGFDPAHVNCGDGGPAASAPVYNVARMALAPDGTLYFSEFRKIRRISPNGIVSTVMGAYRSSGFTADGQRALPGALLCGHLESLAATADGTLLFGEQNKLRSIAPDGTLGTIAGSNPACNSPSTPESGYGGPALQASLASTAMLAPSQQGEVYMMSAQRINRVGRPFPGSRPVISPSRRKTAACSTSSPRMDVTSGPWMR